jgi:hypothetical protein
MNSPDRDSFLIAAPAGSHFAQFYTDARTLLDSVRLFVETGLRRGDGVVVIASADHTQRLLQCLAAAETDPEPLRRSGQLSLLEAEAVLDRFMRGGMPDWAAFRRVVGSAIESVGRAEAGTTRAYGEMVDVLWRQGKPEAAIRLEEYWNDLARLYPFSLFCGYRMDSCGESCYSTPLHEIGRTHSEIIATDEDEEFRNALDAACRDIFGIPLSQTLSLSGHEANPGEGRLPQGQRVMAWLMRNMPNTSAQVLELTRRYLRQQPQGSV